MADIGATTGIIGAITGVIALIVSMKSYALVNSMKALDLRLELNKSYDNLEVVLSGLEGYLDYVHQSHTRVMAATGRSGSGEMVAFEQEFQRDKAQLRILLRAQPSREQNYENSTPIYLETMITSIHALYVQISELRSKYQRLLEADENRRKEIRAQHQV